MNIDFREVKSMSIPEGDVKSLKIGNITVWSKQNYTLQITNTGLRGGFASIWYEEQLRVSTDLPSDRIIEYVVEGDKPWWLNVDSQTGKMSGTPNGAGSYEIKFYAQSGKIRSDEKILKLEVKTPQPKWFTDLIEINVWELRDKNNNTYDYATPIGRYGDNIADNCGIEITKVTGLGIYNYEKVNHGGTSIIGGRGYASYDKRYGEICDYVKNGNWTSKSGTSTTKTLTVTNAYGSASVNIEFFIDPE